MAITIREIDSKESKEFRKMIADPTRLQKFIDDFDYKSRVQKGAFYKIINKSDNIYGGGDIDLFLYAHMIKQMIIIQHFVIVQQD